MASFNNQNSGLQFMTAMASNFNVAGDLPIEDVHNPSNDAVQNDFNADTSATLHPVCPDPDVGYQPLSDYLVAKLLRRTMQYFKNFCAARQVELDTKYWKRYTRRILETQSPDKALVISSPAGSGKSTWMQSFLLALRDVMKEQPEFDLSLVGVVVVLQKVEDLNELADLLTKTALKIIQSWSLCKGGLTRAHAEASAVTHRLTIMKLVFVSNVPTLGSVLFYTSRRMPRQLQLWG